MGGPLSLGLGGEAIDRSVPGARASSGNSVPRLAGAGSGTDRLQAVLAEGREVDNQVRCFGCLAADGLFRSEHRFDSTDASGRHRFSAGVFAFRAWRRPERGPQSGPGPQSWGSGRRPRSAWSACRDRCCGIRPVAPAGRR